MYKHLTYEERKQIAQMLENGHSTTYISQIIGKHNSSIYREITRGTINGKYDPDYAEKKHQQHMANKGSPPILSIDPELASYISTLILEHGYSLNKIIEILSKDERFCKIPSRWTIYTSIDKGLIPGVTRESMRSNITKVFSDGHIHLAKWIREQFDINDGDFLLFEVNENTICFSKVENAEIINHL